MSSAYCSDDASRAKAELQKTPSAAGPCCAARGSLGDEGFRVKSGFSCYLLVTEDMACKKNDNELLNLALQIERLCF